MELCILALIIVFFFFLKRLDYSLAIILWYILFESSRFVVFKLSGSYFDLTIYSLRLLLHENATHEQNKVTQSRTLECEELDSSQAFVERLLEDSLAKLREEENDKDAFVRWELGACWIQHLQDQKKTEKEKKHSNDKPKNEMKVEGLGTPLKSLKNRKKTLDGSTTDLQTENIISAVDEVKNEAEETISTTESQLDIGASEDELMIKTLLSDAAFTRLEESDTGLHAKVMFDIYVSVYALSNVESGC